MPEPTEAASPDEPEAPNPWRRRLRRWAIDLAIVACLYLGLSAWLERDHLSSRSTAPDFQLTNLRGEPVSLDSLRGKKVALHFWATWCGVCRQEFGALNSVYSNLDDDEALVTIVADGDDAQRIRRFAEENELRYPILLGNDRVTEAYRVSAFPTNYFVDKNGDISGSTRGMSTRWGLGTRLEWAD